ncbi:RNA polymerase sigma factor [Populibacterium corticicola]|uniref:RNA polymerase sigma factor n=1 Tax=Populibacterium corticicola TaxID=1812826 RepID=A0ABW5XFJ9_9MICO
MSKDNEIILRSLSRPAEFGDLFFRYAPRIHRYLARRIGESVADDILSETFLVAFEKRATFDQSHTNALPWLFGIAINLVHRHRIAEARTFKLAERTAVIDSVDDETRNSDSAVDAAVEVQRLAGKLRKLNKADRDVLLLYAWEDLTYEQIGVALGIPTGTVRSRLNRARKILRSSSTQQEADHGRVRIA